MVIPVHLLGNDTKANNRAGFSRCAGAEKPDRSGHLAAF